MTTEDSTAIVAVVIACIAFFVTTAQLLQALFGTAEGYRRCQPSVIGLWASKTRRRFRWSEFRFETLFSTPDIRIRRSDKSDMEDGAIHLLGNVASRRRSLVSASREMPTGGHADLVSWLVLLYHLHLLQQAQTFPIDRYLNQRKGLSVGPFHSLIFCEESHVAVTIRERSWDFMPPEIVRPFASSTIGDIVVIAHRLGMGWKEFRPGESIMRAEGNGQSISSTPVRSLGILLQYSNDGLLDPRKGLQQDSLTICSDEADKFGFGIIPGCADLQMKDIPMTNVPEKEAIKNAMRNLDCINIEKYAEQFTGNYDNAMVFFDIIPLAAPWMPIRGSNIVQLRRPFRRYQSALSWWEGYITFHHRLRDLSKPDQISKQMHWVLEKVELMRRNWPWNKVPSWEEESNTKSVKNGRDLYFLKDLHNTWSEATLYLRQMASISLIYSDLVAAHLAVNGVCPSQAQENVDKCFKAGIEKEARWWNGAVRAKAMAETMHLYIDNVPKVAEFLADRGFDDQDAVKDAWWTMILRAMCWERSIAWVDNASDDVVVPSGLYESRVPVYLA